MSNILITGGMGFIGHNVVAKLEKLGHQVTIIDTRTDYGIIPNQELDYLMKERIKKINTSQNYKIDIVDKTFIPGILRDFEIDTIIHLASFPRQKVVNADPQLGSKVMSEGLLNLLEATVYSNVKKFVYVSSSMVYGDFNDGASEDTPCNPQGKYAIMKLAGEWLVKDHTRKYNMSHTIVRPSAVYGPLDVNDRVIAKFFAAAMNDRPIVVNGLQELLDFTYVEDAAEGIVLATLSDNAANKTYNITKGQSRTLLDAADCVRSLVGKGVIDVCNKDSSFPSRGALNIDAARNDLGFNPTTNIEEGLQKYYDWLINTPFWSSTSVR